MHFSVCDLFEDDEETASAPTGSFQSLSCNDFEIDDTVASEYGVTAGCENQVISAVGTGITADFSSSCLDITVAMRATDIDLGFDFSDIEYNETTGDIRGDLGVDYNVTVGTISGIPNFSGIDCDIEMSMDAETEEPSVEDFRGFQCTFTFDSGSPVTISHTDLTEFAQLIAAETDCDDASRTISDLNDYEKMHLAVSKMMDLVDEIIADEERNKFSKNVLCPLS